MEMEAIDVKLADPEPLECLNGSLIPPFLSKTYDLVDEPSLDAIISWSCNGRSFVVKDPTEFSKSVLPRNFKHNNLSSFVRQLNTYGFRKIDPDRLEFANEGFKQGNKHLLKNIQRRKSPQSLKQGGSYLEQSFVETSRSNVEGEVKRLIKEKNLLLQDVVELQQQHVGTVRYMDSLNQKIIMAEQRQKQTISFVVKLFQNPALVSSVEQIKDQTDVGSSRTKRRFANLPMLKYSPSISNVPSITAATDLRQISPKEGHDDIPQKDVHLGSSVKVENVATQEPSIATELTGEQEFIHNEKVRKGEADNHLSEQEFTPEPFVLFENFQEVVSTAVESVIEPENIWSGDLDTITDVSNFDYEPWVDSTHYDVSDFGGTSELSAIWDFDSPQHPRVNKCATDLVNLL